MQKVNNMYGNLGDMIGESDDAIRKSRKKLKVLYTLVNEMFSYSDQREFFKNVNKSLIQIDSILVNGLSSFRNEDVQGVDPRNKVKPKWIKEQEKKSKQS
jgi:hypothetical protein